MAVLRGAAVSYERGTRVEDSQGQILVFAFRLKSLKSFQLSCRSFRFFKLPTQADTESCSAEEPCFISDQLNVGSRAEQTLSRGRIHAQNAPLEALQGSCSAPRGSTLEIEFRGTSLIKKRPLP